MVRSVLAEQHGAPVKLTFDHLDKNVIALELCDFDPEQL